MSLTKNQTHSNLSQINVARNHVNELNQYHNADL